MVSITTSTDIDGKMYQRELKLLAFDKISAERDIISMEQPDINIIINITKQISNTADWFVKYEGPHGEKCSKINYANYSLTSPVGAYDGIYPKPTLVRASVLYKDNTDEFQFIGIKFKLAKPFAIDSEYDNALYIYRKIRIVDLKKLIESISFTSLLHMEIQKEKDVIEKYTNRGNETSKKILDIELYMESNPEIFDKKHMLETRLSEVINKMHTVPLTEIPLMESYRQSLQDQINGIEMIDDHDEDDLKRAQDMIKVITNDIKMHTERLETLKSLL
jgi:hypothetical protein